MPTNFHEDLQRGRPVLGSSNRAFGLWFALIFGALAATGLRAHPGARTVAVALGIAFLLAGLTRPAILGPLNRVWTRFGLLLGKVTNPVVMALLFYGVFTPIGVLMRWSGKDPLRLKREPGSDSYWIDRDPPGPEPGTMVNQF